ncbi:MAG TPA: MFS transporter [Thermoleophilia bacterium]|nr:MFS transporter [Thermoleophilia bacterium]
MTRALFAANRRTFASLRRHRNYRLFFMGQVISVSGTWMQNIATAWLVLALTHSAVAVGVLAVFQFLPFTVLGLFAGVLVDRLDPRRTVILTQTSSMLLAFALTGLTVAGVVTAWEIYLLTALRGIVLVLDAPARQALTFQMVGRDELPNAVALNSSLFNAARVVGPAVGGVLVATAGVGWCFGLNAASYLAVLAGLLMMRRDELFPVGRAADAPTFLRGTAEALAFVWRSPLLLVSLTTVFVVSTFSFNFNVLLPVLARTTLDSGPGTFGIVTAFFGAGALTGALIAASLSRASRRAMLLGAAGLGLAQLLVAPEASLASVSLFLFAAGMAFTVWSASANAILQLNSPDHIRGRVIGLYYFAFNGSGPAGGLLAGWLAAKGGTELAFAAAGVLALAMAAVATMALRGRPAPAGVGLSPG